MAQQTVRLTADGIITDVSAFGNSPPGGLHEAQNVMFRRAGVAETRGGFQYTFDTSTTSEAKGVFNFGGQGYAVHGNTLRQNATTTITGPTSFTQGQVFATNTSGRCLFTSGTGVFVLDDASDTTARKVGLPRPFAPEWSTAAGTGWLANNSRTAYRAVYVRYSGTTPIESAPSSFSMVTNTSGASIPLTITVWLHTEIVAGDIVHIYRTPTQIASVTAVPSDEMRLRAALTVTSTDVTNGYVTFTDLLPDAEWSGPTIYTAAGQEGPIAINGRPYYCRDVATYNGMTFYGGHYSPEQLTLSLKASTTTSSDPSQALSGNVFTGSTTLGLPTITGVAAGVFAYLAVGQILSESAAGGGDPTSGDASFPGGTAVVSWNSGAGTITVDQNALQTAGPTSLQVWDWVEVDDGTNQCRIYANVSATNVNGTFRTSLNPAAPEIAFANTFLLSGAAVPSTVELHVDGTGTTGQTWTFQSITYPGATFTVRSTKPNAWDRYVDRTTGIQSAQDGGTGRLLISKVNLPEAVPPTNFRDLGSSASNFYIRKLMPTQACLWIFTSAGLYRAYGDSPETLTIDEFDPTVSINTSQTSIFVTRLGDVVYAFTSRGAVAVTSGGARNFDQALYTRLQDDNLSIAFSGWACASNAHQMVLFGYKNVNAPDGTSYAYVYFPKTNAWAKWRMRRYITAGDPSDQDASYPVAGAGLIANFNISTTSLTDSSAMVPAYDSGTESVNLATINGQVLTISAGSRWTPAVGDAYAIGSNGGSGFIITAVASATQFTVVGNTSLLSTGVSYPWGEYFDVKLVWDYVDGDNAGIDKMVSDVVYLYDALKGGTTITFRYNGFLANTSSDVTESITYDSTAETYKRGKPATFRRLVPPSLGRDIGTLIGFSTAQAGLYMATAGISLIVKPMNTRVTRQ